MKAIVVVVVVRVKRVVGGFIYVDEMWGLGLCWNELAVGYRFELRSNTNTIEIEMDKMRPLNIEVNYQKIIQFGIILLLRTLLQTLTVARPTLHRWPRKTPLRIPHGKFEPFNNLKNK